MSRQLPERITRAQVADLVRSLGLDPQEVTGLRIDLDSVEAEVLMLDEQGTVNLSRDPHWVSIPIVN